MTTWGRRAAVTLGVWAVLVLGSWQPVGDKRVGTGGMSGRGGHGQDGFVSARRTAGTNPKFRQSAGEVSQSLRRKSTLTDIWRQKRILSHLGPS